MSGKNPLLKPLELRKSLLVAESNLNRAYLVADLAELAAGIHSFTDRAESVGAAVSSATSLVAGLAAFRLDARSEHGSKPSRLHSLLRGAEWALSLWRVFFPQGRARKSQKSVTAPASAPR